MQYHDHSLWTPHGFLTSLHKNVFIFNVINNFVLPILSSFLIFLYTPTPSTHPHSSFISFPHSHYSIVLIHFSFMWYDFQVLSVRLLIPHETSLIDLFLQYAAYKGINIIQATNIKSLIWELNTCSLFSNLCQFVYLPFTTKFWRSNCLCLNKYQTDIIPNTYNNNYQTGMNQC